MKKNWKGDISPLFLLYIRFRHQGSACSSVSCKDQPFITDPSSTVVVFEVIVHPWGLS